MWSTTWLLVLVLCLATSYAQVDYVVEEEQGEDSAVANVTLISDMLDLFNLKRTMKLWPDMMQENLIENSNCTDELEAYFQGIEEKRIWALKSELFYDRLGI